MAKASHDNPTKLLPEFLVGEPVRLQPANPKAPWEEGPCVARVGPRAFLIQTDNENLYKRNREFIRQVPSKARDQSPLTQISDQVPV